MRTIYYKIVLILTLIPSISQGNTLEGLVNEHTMEKSLYKEFTVDKDALLFIDNAYGNVDITTWNENRIVMNIKISVTGNDKEKMQEKIKNISVIFNASTTRVSAKTIFDNKQSSWWSKFTDSWSSTSSINMKINYSIKVPISNNLDLSNDYGSITLDKTKGNAKINCDYGQIILGELHGNDNSIHIDYTKNSSIKYMNQGTINADYSAFEVGLAGKVDLYADYTQSNFDSIQYLKYSCDYGELKISNAHSITGTGDYLNMQLGTVNKKIAINADYGSLRVNELTKSVKMVDIQSDYVGITIGYNQNLSFDFHIKTSYGGINIDDDEINIMKKNSTNSNKIYEGYHRQKNSGNSIRINSSYGGVKFIKK
ncbi:hypothetical protein ACE939_06110 [Aquimarina sp. W85]|uniref:hypothetical protein n=1 Tax=Aquimarina rhodophyticola TaxID=3342246 RepID=UPI00366C0FD0